MNKIGYLDSLIDEWAADLMRHVHRGGYSGINAVERILKDPGISTKISGHVVLWWPKTRRIAKMSKAMHQVSPIEQIVLVVDSGHLLNDDRSVFTKAHLAKNSSLEVRRFNDFRKKAKAKLSSILWP